MEKSKLHQSIIAVAKEVKNIDKSMTVGEGKMRYKGVADKDVKLAIGQAMANNNLTCVCIDIQPTTTIERWEETNQYGTKQKQSVFTEVICKYQITHSETSESIIISGYGHGVDSMDKSAGKATTYALKNALLYTFLVPTGAIDDTDNTHSDNIEVPKKAKPKLDDVKWTKAINAVITGQYSAEYIRSKYDLTDEQNRELIDVNEKA